jgi:lysophospholipase L1-like esterase
VLQGDVVLQGFSLVYDEAAPMTIDVFGIPSATVKGWSNADLSYLKASLPADAYDAIILEYGTNEGAVDRFEPSRYAAMLGASLRSVRHVFPHSACLLMGPTDRGVRVPAKRTGRLDLLKYSRIHQQITRIQADVGGDFGCVVWDWQRYMGGNGSIYSWARETPPLAAYDLIHLTPLGYRRTAAALGQSVGWLAPQ